MSRRVTTRYRMNPCDCLFHAFDYLMQQHGLVGSGTYMVLEAAGTLAPTAVSNALRRAMEAHPLTMSAAAVMRWGAWPCWRLDDAPVAPHYTFDDLSGEAEWISRADELCHERLSRGWDQARPPQVRIEHYRGPGQRHRICLRWPHALMDAAGGLYFLSEMNRLGAARPSEPPAGLLSSQSSVDPLAGFGLLRRVGLMIRGVRERAPSVPVRETALCMSLPDRPADSRRLRDLVRTWSPDAVASMRARARKLAPPGPARYSRYLAGCVLRAVHRVHREYGRELPYHGVMFPMRMPGLTRRPLAGNYVVAAPLSISPDRIDDRRAVAEDIAEQIGQWLGRGSHWASWALQRLVAELHISHYRRLIGWQTSNQPYVTGFSYYAELEPPLRSFLGAEVVNLQGGTVISIPPAWNVAFAMFAERINLVITWPEAAFPPGVVTRYADLIEEEVFAG